MKQQASITSFLCLNQFQSQKKAKKLADDDVSPGQQVESIDLCDVSSTGGHVQNNTVVGQEEERNVRHQRWQDKLLGNPLTGGGIAQPTREGGKLPYTPLEKQVLALQQEYHPDCVLAIECGYKYRFFGRDAEIASKVLGIFSYPDRNFLNASVPTGRIHYHIQRLVSAGYKVGVVTQTETAAIKAANAQTRSQPFKREVTALYTPATMACQSGDVDSTGGDDGDFLNEQHMPSPYSNEQKSSYLVCVIEGKTMACRKGIEKANSGEENIESVEIGIVAIECSTGCIWQSCFQDGPMRMGLEARILFAKPADLLLVTPISSNTRRLLENYCAQSAGVQVMEIGRPQIPRTSPQITSSDCDPSAMEKVHALPNLVQEALSHCLEYLRPFGLETIVYESSQILDFTDVAEMSHSPSSILQLEILRNSDDGSERGSLLWLMDRTTTAFGSRLMRKWVTHPLKDVNRIQERLDAVEEIIQHTCESSGGEEGTSPLVRLQGLLRTFPDVERSLGRILHKTIQPSEFYAFLESFKNIGLLIGLESTSMDVDGFEDLNKSVSSPLLQVLIQKAASKRAASVAVQLMESLDKCACEKNSIVDIFLNDMFEVVAEKKKAVANLMDELENLRPKLADTLGQQAVEFISLQNQGEYLIELPISRENKVPSDWVKISSTKKMVRYQPPEVKAIVQQLELAREYLVLSARNTWKNLIGEFCTHFGLFRSCIQSLAQLDCLISLASLSASSGYTKPELITLEYGGQPHAGPLLHIMKGRHPILEVLQDGTFVPNDTTLGGGNEICRIITGPNMGGKSCYVKMQALIVCMAQIGCFVPAEKCTLKPFDAIYTRMGAADSIALGRSTFLEELAETSYILRKATSSSLVIIDELGRGTSTKEGLPIAEATLDYVVNTIGAATFFVTHFPEIGAQASHTESSPKMRSFYMSYKISSSPQDANDSIPKVVFLYTITPGVAQSSYGLNVARMSGISQSIISRAGFLSRSIRNSIEEAALKRAHVIVSNATSSEDIAVSNLSKAQQLVHDLVMRGIDC